MNIPDSSSIWQLLSHQSATVLLTILKEAWELHLLLPSVSLILLSASCAAIFHTLHKGSFSQLERDVSQYHLMYQLSCTCCIASCWLEVLILNWELCCHQPLHHRGAVVQRTQTILQKRQLACVYSLNSDATCLFWLRMTCRMDMARSLLRYELSQLFFWLPSTHPFWLLGPQHCAWICLNSSAY